MSAIFRAYNDWLADPRNARRAAVRGLPHRSHPIDGHRDDQPGRRPERGQGAGARRPPGPLRRDDHRVSARAPALRMKAFHPALSMCDMIFSGVFERHPRLRVAIVEFKLA